MKRFLCLAVALVATAIFATGEVNAQDFGPGCGYGYGYGGIGYSYRTGFERPPYFALFPPVHYSDQIVRRPYGVSPFAAPSGVTPVEMQAPAVPLTVRNPYFKPKATQVANKKQDTDT